MIRIIAVILIVSVLLSACAGKDASSTPVSEAEAISTSSEPASSPEPGDSGSAIPAEDEPEAAPAGLAGWKKPVKPTLSHIQQAEYWTPVFRYLTRCYRDVFLRDEAPIIKDGIYPVHIQLARLGIEVPGGALTYEQYAALTELFWGAPAAKESMEYVLGVTGDHAVVDPQSRTIQMDEEDMSTINTEQYSVQTVEPLDGVDEVTLTMLFSINPQEPYRTITYRLFWDEWAGYLPRAVSWEYVPTNRTSMEGDAELFPALWGKNASVAYDYHNGYMNLKYNKGHIVAIGATAYRFRTDGKSLLADTLDLDTLEQREGMPIIQMDEDIRGVVPRHDGVILYTDSTVLRLGKDLRERARKPIPSAVRLEDVRYPVFQGGLAYMAFSREDGLYLCELSEGAQPRLLREHWKGERVVEYDYLYPLEFLEGDRLYAAASVWEASAGYYLVMDYEGNELKRLDYFTSGEHSGGYHSYSPERAVYYRNENNHTYDFSTGKLEEAAWLNINYHYNYNDLYDPAHPSRWYFSVPSDEYEPERTDFMLIDFDDQTVTPLPLVVHGGTGGVLAVAETGHILFVYSYRGEGSFGVLTVK